MRLSKRIFRALTSFLSHDPATGQLQLARVTLSPTSQQFEATNGHSAIVISKKEGDSASPLETFYVSALELDTIDYAQSLQHSPHVNPNRYAKSEAVTVEEAFASIYPILEALRPTHIDKVPKISIRFKPETLQQIVELAMAVADHEEGERFVTLTIQANNPKMANLVHFQIEGVDSSLHIEGLTASVPT